MVDNTFSLQAQELIDFIAQQGYVCPWGQAWDKLWKMLPHKNRAGSGWEPALPLILAGWYASSNFEKSLRLREHIEWADRHGAIKSVDRYLRDLPEEDWHKKENSKYPNGGMAYE